MTMTIFMFEDFKYTHKVPWNIPPSGIMLEVLIQAKVASTKNVELRENSWVLFYLIADNLETQMI